MNIKESSVRMIALIISFAAGVIITISAWSFYVGGWRTDVEKDIRQLKKDVTCVQSEQERQREYEITSAKQLARIEQQITNMRQDVMEIKESLRSTNSAWAIKKNLTGQEKHDSQ